MRTFDTIQNPHARELAQRTYCDDQWTTTEELQDFCRFGVLDPYGRTLAAHGGISADDFWSAMREATEARVADGI